MNANLFVLLKSFEVLARAMFILGVSYTLPIEDAGRFGLCVSATSVFAFIVGWERYLDFQRDVVGKDEVYFDKKLYNALHFYIFNHVLLLPIYLWSIWMWTDFNYIMLACCIFILIGEQVGNQVYQIGLVNSRYKGMICILFARSVVLLIAVLGLMIWDNGRSNLFNVISVWSIISVFFIIGVSKQWSSVTTHIQDETEIPVSFSQRIFTQHKVSIIHFIIGLVAIMSLQLDRLVIGSILNLSQTGVYFRNLLVSSTVLQFYNIVFYNRMVPKIMHLAKDRDFKEQKTLISREIVFVLFFLGLMVAFFGAVDLLTHGVVFLQYNMLWELIIILLIAVFIRIIADYVSLILHSYIFEKLVLKAQIITFVLTIPIMFLLTYQFKLLGAAISMLLASILYAVISVRFLLVSSARLFYAR